MKSRSIRLTVIGLAVMLGAMSLPLPTVSTASAHAANAASTKPMTNKDVIKLTKLGFGGNVIKSKIDQAPDVNFKLEVDDLVSLKQAGVSQDVISYMLNRAGGGAPVASAGPGQRGAMNAAATPLDVTMATKNGDVRLRGTNGTTSTRSAFVTVLVYNNYPDTAAKVRTHDTRPSFTVYSRNNPKGTIYLVSLEVDSDDQARSLKMGNSGFGSIKNVGAPDKDNQVPYEAVQIGNRNGNMWRLTPTKDLKPGEYGVLYGSLFDFGVDS